MKIPVVAAACILALIVGYLAFHRELLRVLPPNLFQARIPLSQEEWTGGASYKQVRYAGLSESEYLDLYVPDSDAPCPLFVLIHGGGFFYGDSQSRQAQFMYRYFRDHGYACASVHYRLSGEAGYPAAIEDVKAAIRYLRANANTYGFDAERIAVWGESAGGYLAAMAAFSDDTEF